jgi:hypothetical protein
VTTIIVEHRDRVARFARLRRCKPTDDDWSWWTTQSSTTISFVHD